MYRRVEDFLKAWQAESASTLKILDALTDVSLSQQIVEGHRKLGQMAWHIVTAVPEMMNRTGLNIGALSAEVAQPATAVEMRRAYAAVSKQLVDQIEADWNDSTLNVVDEMYGEKWARGLTLKILLDHQTHHRGQMTVLMRQAGLRVPGVYGPSKEEWAEYGMPAPEV